MKGTVLIIEHDPQIRAKIKRDLGHTDLSVLEARNRSNALKLLEEHTPSVITLDLDLPSAEEAKIESFKCLHDILRISPASKIITTTPSRDREVAVKAVAMGAWDHFIREENTLGEFLNVGVFLMIVRRALDIYELEQEGRESELFMSSTEGLIGQSLAMQSVYHKIQKIAPTVTPVLLLGERGTGKKLTAKVIHDLSPRRTGLFVQMNCGSFPELELDSFMFGSVDQVPGRTSSVRTGRLQQAKGGSIFLEDVVKLPVRLQTRLVRFLEQGKIDLPSIPADVILDVRVIASSDSELRDAVDEGLFRGDLYYRLGVVNIALPPLRDREGDVLLLAQVFFRRFRDKHSKKIKKISPLSMEHLASYSWPGNVAELENKIERAVLMCEGRMIEPHDLGFSGKPLKQKRVLEEAMTLKDAREKAEREVIFSAIERHGGNTTRAAEELGISRPTLYDLMKKHGLHGKN